MTRLLALNFVALLVLIFVVNACAGYRAKAQTAEDAAEIICVAYYAEERNIAYDQALRDFCTTAEELKPWVDEVLSAKNRIARAKSAPVVTTVYLDRPEGGV